MRRLKRRVLYIMITVITAAAVTYLGIALYFTKHFFFNTIINGENYSVSAVNSVQNGFLDTSSQYVLRINGRDGVTDTITAADIALRVDFGSEFEDIIEGQEALLWPASVFKETEYTVDTMVTYSKEALEKKIDTLSFFESENIRQPQDAYLSDYTENGYQIIPEDKGAVPIREKIRSAVEEAISLLDESVDLDARDCYVSAGVTSDDRALRKECEERNRFVGVTVTYVFGEETEVLDGSIIKDWITVDDRTVSLDPELVREYVNGLSRKYDTWGKKREFQTTGGEVITMAEGAYGWWMNRADETQALIEQIESGQSGERTPIYRAEAAQYCDDDIGDTYVEIDLTSQHLWVYKDGELVEETDFVSGNVSRGYNTPVGVYGITYKERNATLRGATYTSHVDYWIPFNGNVGMHDASWRSSFGADIYLRNGSHGCVNLPSKKAEKIYEYVEKGEPVIVYGGQTSVPKPETSEEPETVMDPEEAAFTELTQEQQIQLLIEAGLLNPDGTPVQQPQETLPQTPQETLPPASQEILPPAPQDIPVENIPQIPPNLPQEGLPEQPQNTSEM